MLALVPLLLIVRPLSSLAWLPLAVVGGIHASRPWKGFSDGRREKRVFCANGGQAGAG
jgi:hypothetical protein